jgi:acetyl esterase/lipase
MVAGDSAGANLAAALAIAAAAEGVRIIAAALLYGIYDYHRALPALAGIVGGGSPESQHYLPSAEFDRSRGDARLSPESAAGQLPPCWIGVGAHDPLVAESTELAAELSRLGRDHELHVAPNSGHSFLQIPFDPGYDAGWRRLLAYLGAR